MKERMVDPKDRLSPFGTIKRWQFIFLQDAGISVGSDDNATLLLV
jgi:hypothetical protein